MKNAMETYTELYWCWIANIMYLVFIYLKEYIPFTHTKSDNLLISLGVYTFLNWKLLNRQVLISHSCSCFCAAQLLQSYALHKFYFPQELLLRCYHSEGEIEGRTKLRYLATMEHSGPFAVKEKSHFWSTYTSERKWNHYSCNLAFCPYISFM